MVCLIHIPQWRLPDRTAHLGSSSASAAPDRNVLSLNLNEMMWNSQPREADSDYNLLDTSHIVKYSYLSAYRYA